MFSWFVLCQAFSMLTRKALYSGIWELGSPTFGVRSFIVYFSLAYFPMKEKWCGQPMM